MSDHERPHLLGARRAKGSGAFLEGGAGRHDVVDEHQRRRWRAADGERPGDIATTLGCPETDLGAGGAHPNEASGNRRPASGRGPRQKRGLIVAASALAPGMKRHRNEDVVRRHSPAERRAEFASEIGDALVFQGADGDGQRARIRTEGVDRGERRATPAATSVRRATAWAAQRRQREAGRTEIAPEGAAADAAPWKPPVDDASKNGCNLLTDAVLKIYSGMVTRILVTTRRPLLTGLTGLAVRPRLLSEEIYSTLRNAIIEERLPPGMKIVEERLASELGVSRIPLREALHKLERDGFVESLAHRGFRVASFTETDIRQIYEIREFLEVPAAVKAMDALRKAGFSQLEEALEAMRESVTTNEPVRIVSQHVRFHQIIYNAGDNPRLVEMLGPFMELGFTYRVARRAGINGWDEFLNAHQRLIDVLRDGTPEEVRDEMIAHLRLGQRTSLSVLTG